MLFNNTRLSLDALELRIVTVVKSALVKAVETNKRMLVLVEVIMKNKRKKLNTKLSFRIKQRYSFIIDFFFFNKSLIVL